MEIFKKVGEKAKELGGKAKDIGGKAGERAKDLGDRAKVMTKRSSELLEIAKIKYEISKLEKEMENNLAGIGALIYQRFKGEEGHDAEIDRLSQATRDLEDTISSLEEQITKLQPKQSKCEQCELELPEGSRYCCYCGDSLEKEG